MKKQKKKGKKNIQTRTSDFSFNLIATTDNVMCLTKSIIIMIIVIIVIIIHGETVRERLESV